jgi:hypothetical protein
MPTHLIVDDLGSSVAKQQTKTVIVNTLSDLPTAVGGKISLVSGFIYLLCAPINIGTDYIEMANNSKLDSIGKDLTTITYGGVVAAIKGVDVSCTIREISVVGASKGFEFTGTGVEGVNIFQSTFTGCTKVGTATDMFVFKMANSTFIANTDGITLIDCSFINVDITNWFSNNTGKYIDIPSGSYESIKISDNNMDISTGEIGIFIDESNITHNQEVVLMGNQLVGTSTTYYDGFNPLDGNFFSYSNVGLENTIFFPPVTTTEMFNIANPRDGMPLFNITLNKVVFWDSTLWKSFDDSVIFNSVLIDDFESGSFATNGWTTVQGGENDWYVGIADPLDGTYSAYISNDAGTSNAYTSFGGALDVSHVYIDILMPAATTDLVLQFDWICEGEVSFDYGQVHDIVTSTTPVANTELGATGLVGQTQYNNQSTKATEQISLPIGEAGTTRRIVFSWRNDSSVENQPPMNIDNVKILYL